MFKHENLSFHSTPIYAHKPHFGQLPSKSNPTRQKKQDFTTDSPNEEERNLQGTQGPAEIDLY